MTDRRPRPAPVPLLAPVLVTLLTVLLASCSADPSPESQTPPASPSSTTAPPDPPPTAAARPRPETGTCHRLSFDEALSPTATVGSVPCRKAHTAETYAVGTVDNLVDGHLLAIDSDRVQRQVAETCPAELGAAVGGSIEQQRLSMLRAVWFTPTVEESDAGASWYRCDAIVLAGADTLSRVQGSLTGVLDTDQGRQRYGMCGTAGPDERSFERVLCADPHSWRAFSVRPLPDGRYPGRAAVSRAGQPCKDAAAAIADDSLDYEWGFEGPDAEQWAAGQTFIRCWAPD
ncbi:septum formation family protein [Nocardioides sp.]|uniref:septum formation family protein n=1 Tax=Nocardioides sp. TaxID=35761 RepID=UPI002628F70B|nr:septum formation family protein [Nocardioides sp.]